MQQNPARQVYDYTQTGINSFLSRSIEDVAWESTLDAHLNTLQNTVVDSTAQNYDTTQVTGSLGNTLQMGNVNINQNSITMSDGANTVLFIGNDSGANTSN